MGLFDKVFKKSSPIPPTPEEKFNSFRSKLLTHEKDTLDKLGITSLELLENIPVNLLQIQDFSSEELQPLASIQKAVLENPSYGLGLNGAMHNLLCAKYKSVPINSNEMAWWWLCKDYSVVDTVTSKICRANVHKYLLSSLSVYADEKLYHINSYMAPDIVTPNTGAKDQMYLGYRYNSYDDYVECRAIDDAWNEIAHAFPNGGIKPPSSKYEHDVHSYIARVRSGFGWTW